MRIGIITHWWSNNNYGQLLQCWALQETLRRMGHDAYLIRFQRQQGKGRIRRALGRGIRDNANRVVERILPSRRAMRSLARQRDVERDFNGFRDSFLATSATCYAGIDALRNSPPGADAYITGSDQVWLFPLGDPDTAAFYLDFGDAGIRRVAYAASIGRDLEPNEEGRFAELVGGLDAVSVREPSAAALCTGLGLDASVSLDPTLLLPASVYEAIASEPMSDADMAESYTLSYVINLPNADSFRWRDVRKWADDSDMPVRAVYSSGYLPARELLDGAEALYPTIPEWLSLVRSASHVVTSSFHGVVFSVLFHRPFVSIPLGGRFSRANDRVRMLLEALDLSDRICAEGDSFDRCMVAPVDWEAVDAKLEGMRQDSIRFLEDALKGDANAR